VKYTVIDTIAYTKSWTFRYPELAGRGDGLMVLLDPDQITEAPDVAGRTVTVRLPNGSISRFEAAASEAHHATVGIFLPGAKSRDIPRGSQLDW
jgi:hypothetical protein